MGYRASLKSSIKNQIIIAVILILVCSFFATVITYIAITITMRPSVRTVEDTSNLVKRYVSTHGATILRASEQPKLQSLVKGTAVEYLVMDANARPIYGNLPQATILTRADMIRKMNIISVQSQGIVLGRTVNTVIPVLGAHDSLNGAVYVKWEIYPGGTSHPTVWTRVLTFSVLLSPFVFMVLFTYMFARRVGKRMNAPLQVLAEATRKIKERDLNFSIDYHGQNEIGRVLEAFEDMRQDLKASLRAQWTLEEERREMLSAVSHDVRTPITIIQGHLENLLENPSPTSMQIQRFLETVARNIHRVTRLMEDFRAVNDIDSHGFTLHSVETNLADYIESKYRDFLVVAGSRDISMSLDYKDFRLKQGPMPIDADRVSQVLDNLMTNAIRFTPKDGHIGWNARIYDGKVEMTIEDTGQGFPPEESDNLFRKFYQVDKSRSGGGYSGLGLYIARVLVEKHGGAIRAENNSQGGATFKFYVRTINQN